MKHFPFKPIEQTMLNIKDSKEKYPVSHVYCVGRNYTSHAKEMGVDDRKPPFIFTKPTWTLTTSDVKYPNGTNDLQHCLLYTSPSPRDLMRSRMPSSA